jgi:hypothetical protein
VSHAAHSVWVPGKSVISQHQDKCKVGWWILAHNPLESVQVSIHVKGIMISH